MTTGVNGFGFQGETVDRGDSPDASDAVVVQAAKRVHTDASTQGSSPSSDDFFEELVRRFKALCPLNRSNQALPLRAVSDSDFEELVRRFEKLGCRRLGKGSGNGTSSE